jgi:heme-degrading monooxygenase HmoA
MSAPAYVALSRFRVANGMSAEVEAAFQARPHLVDDAPGFVRMDVLSPADDAAEFWLITYWTDEKSFRAWHASHLYRDSHGGIPKGLKLDPQATEVRAFRVVSS